MSVRCKIGCNDAQTGRETFVFAKSSRNAARAEKGMTRCFAEKASRSISDKSFYMLENAKKPALLFFSRALRGYVLVLTHWPGPDTTVLPRLIIGLLLFVRHLVQAWALPIGFACFFKEKDP